MPIYEYGCEACSSRFEVLSSFSEREDPRSCPVCESTSTRVLISSFASLAGGGEAAGPSPSSGGCACGGSCGCGA